MKQPCKQAILPTNGIPACAVRAICTTESCGWNPPASAKGTNNPSKKNKLIYIGFTLGKARLFDIDYALLQAAEFFRTFQIQHP